MAVTLARVINKPISKGIPVMRMAFTQSVPMGSIQLGSEGKKRFSASEKLTPSVRPNPRETRIRVERFILLILRP